MNVCRGAVAGLLLLSACGQSPVEVRDGDASTARGDGAPEILELAVTPKRLTETTVVRVEATVVDPEDDLASGRLETEAGVSIGVFVNASDSAYVFPLGWQMLTQVDPVEFEGIGLHTLYVRFMDVEGHITREPVQIELECSTGAACGGRCVDLTQDDENCGRCGRVCADQGSSWCSAGFCTPQLTDCIPIGGGITCDEVCEERGNYCTARSTCSNRAGEVGSFQVFQNLADCESPGSSSSQGHCGQWLDPNYVSYVRCCCGVL